MKCSKCRSEAVIEQPYSGLSLCMRHLISDIEIRAKKEIRKKGGLASHERIYLRGELEDFSLFALRVFVSSLFLKRTDITFVASPKDATTVFTADTLDDVASALLDAVLAGKTTDYLEKKQVRTIAPMSVIPTNELFLYAKAHGWKGDELTLESTPQLTTHTFLNEFSKTRPSTKYALKNTADYLENIL